MRMLPQEVERLCKSLKPIIGEQAEALWLSYLAEDDKGKREVEQLLPLLAAQLLGKRLDEPGILLSPPSREAAAGDLPIGDITYNGQPLFPLCLREEDLIRQVGIFSLTGGGKSNLGMHIALMLLRRKTPFLIVDWRRSYRNMLSLSTEDHPGLKDVQVFTVGRGVSPFNFNPFRGPPNVHYKTWLSIMAEVFERSHLGGPGVVDFFLKIYDNYFEQNGAPSDEAGYPNFHDGLRELENFKVGGREFMWKQSTGRILRTFTYGPLAGFFNSRHPEIKLEELLGKPVILELDVEMPQWVRVFVMELILRWIHLFRLSQGDSPKLNGVLILEEAHNLFPKTPLQKGISNLESIFREIRGSGQGIISMTQHTSLLPIYILGNCQVQVHLALQHGDDIDASKKSLFLERDEAVFLDRTKVGEGVVKIKGRVNPCLVRFPLVPIRTGVVDDDFLRNRIGGSFADLRRNNPKSEVVTVISGGDKILTDPEKRLLVDVLASPLCAVSARYKNLGINPRQGSALKDALVSADYLAAREFSTGKGRVVILELTERGREYLRGAGHSVPEADGNESLEHAFWKHRVAHYYRQKGFIVDVEKFVNGRPDLIVSNGGAWAAIEIETGKSDPMSNVTKNLARGFPSIILVATSATAQKAIQAQLAEADLAQDSRIQVVSAKVF